MNNNPEKINLLVYGTLRVGQYNESRFGGFTAAASNVINDFVVNGRMHNVSKGRPMYPVVDFTREGRVVGDLLMDISVHDHTFQSVYRMEIGAGYILTEIGHVNTLFGPTPIHAFHFPIEEAFVGEFIEDGDWIKFDESFDWAVNR
jgi:hypothetical protein